MKSSVGIWEICGRVSHGRKLWVFCLYSVSRGKAKLRAPLSGLSMHFCCKSRTGGRPPPPLSSQPKEERTLGPKLTALDQTPTPLSWTMSAILGFGRAEVEQSLFWGWLLTSTATYTSHIISHWIQRRKID